MLLPAKKSNKWIYWFLSILIINFSALLLAILSAMISLISSLGYFGIKYFSLVFIIADIIGIIYLFFIVLSNASDGWSDLTSIIGYMTITGFGIIAGTITEVIFRIVKRKK